MIACFKQTEPIWIFILIQMNPYEEQVVSQRIIAGCTPDYVVSQISEIPLIYQHWKKNTQENQKILIDAFMRLPSKADCPGFIYGFRQRENYNPADRSYWIKMGRTRRSVPQDRIFEWEKADQHSYNQIFTVRSEHNNKLELLVHLIFAYARKPIRINGNLRIQWFQFQEKVPTAAITNLANLLMEKIHEKFIDKIEELEVQTFPAYDSIVEQLIRNYKFDRDQCNIAAFGLPKTGKSIFQSIIAEDEVLVEQGQRNLKLSAKAKNQKERNFIQISDFDNFANPEQATELYFATWHKLCSSKAILPLLFVKQSDLESSKLIGFTQALNLIQRYVKVSNKLIVVVTHATPGLTSSEVKECIKDNKQYLGKDQLAYLDKSEYIIIRKPEKVGPLMTTAERTAIKQLLDAENEQLLKESSRADSLLEFTMEKEHLKTCHQIIQKSYQVLQPIFAQKFEARFTEYLQEDLRDVFVQNVSDIIRKMKQQNQSQQVVHREARLLGDLLELSPKQQVQSFLYVFSEFCANKTMQYSEIMGLLLEKVNEKIAEINYKYISTLDSDLQRYTSAISLYLASKQEEFVDPLMEVMKLTNITTMIGIFRKIIERGNSSKTPEVATFIKATKILVEALTSIEDKINKGFRLDSSLGKIRQAIYYGLKGKAEEAEETKSVEPFTEVDECDDSEMSSIEGCVRQEINNLSSLNKKISEYKEGSVVLNVVKQFTIDAPPAKYSIEHNLIVLAKEIKVYRDCTISFKGVFKGSDKKLKLIVMAEQYTNISKLTIPKTSPNGIGLLLNINQGRIISVRPEANAQEFQKSKDLFGTLKKIYDSKFT